MSKLARKTFPSNHCADDFECFGPPAIEDGNFDDCMIADLGCFNQDMIDSNKEYHGAVVRSKKNQKWFAYFEWGRTGSQHDFLFHACASKEEAQRVFAKQLHSKNDKRGEWTTIAGHKTLRAKAGKDCYLVRPTAKRSTGLPDAQKIVHDDSDVKKKTAKTGSKKKATKAKKARFDAHTMELGRALTGGTISYTKTSLSGGYLPTQSAINEGRDILAEATRRIGKLGKSKDKYNDTELRQLTATLYSRIPKIKERGVPDEDWILTDANIQAWQFDLDAFESALLSEDVPEVQIANDPFDGMDLEMVWMDPTSLEGKFIHNWMPKASANRHYNVRDMHIRNMWALRQPPLLARFNKQVGVIAGGTKQTGREKPKFQPKVRTDLKAPERKKFSDANVAMLFHGTRSVNCIGILRTGLKLPKQLTGVAITGALFGGGAYFADDWKKSDGYTSRVGTYWANGGGNVKGRGAFMFVSDVALGNPECCRVARGYSRPPVGCHSVFGKARFTDMGYGSKLQNNEWIVYDVSQINMRYLVEYDVK